MAWRLGADLLRARASAGSIPEIGKLFGVLLAVAGPVGALGGSWLGDVWRRRGVAHG